MLHVTLTSLLARKWRLLGTGVAVLLGVAFMAGTLVLTDTIGRTFDDLFATVNEGTDAHVRGEAAFESTNFGVQRPLVDESLVKVIVGVDGVKGVEGSVQGYAQLVGKDGEPLGDPGQGAPTFGGNWGDGAEGLNPFSLAEGRAPSADDEVVIDKGSAKKAGYRVGDRATVLTKGPSQQVTIVGIARFGTADSPGGATFVLFPTAAAQRLVGQPGKFVSIGVVAAEGVSEESLRASIAQAVPDDIEVLTGAEITAENQSDIKEDLSFFNTFMLVFALVALFVGSFIIYNSFSIIVAQRSREMALLRAMGASKRQVLGSVLVEALVVGLIASVLGLVAGVGVAAGLKALLAGFGIDIPAGGIVLTPNTVLISVLTGTLVSVVAAVVPARKAAKVAPVAAMRDVAVDVSGRSRLRVLVGGAVLALGVASLFSGLFGGGDNALSAVGAGAALVFLGVAVLGPVIAGPACRLLGAPLPGLAGMTGTLARQNAMRNPKRTSATAAALMIGVGLVGFITIFASSAKASFGATIDKALSADFVVDSGSFGFGGLSPDLAARLNELPEVEAASGVRLGVVEIDGGTKDILAVDPATYSRVADLGVTQGGLDRLGDDGIAVQADEAEKKGWGLGDRAPVRFAETGSRTLTVAAIYEDEDLAGNYVISTALHQANFPDLLDNSVLIDAVDSVPASQARAAIETVVADYPTGDLQDQTGYKESQAAQIDQILNLIYVLLFLAVFIALLGIANTLALSILERTRELGVLRAVGMTRRQVRSLVRYESVVIALLGTALGLVVGVFFGWAMVKALADEGISTLEVPVGQLVVVTAIAALAGVLAAVLPARRASRLDVLQAIATA